MAQDWNDGKVAYFGPVGIEATPREMLEEAARYSSGAVGIDFDARPLGVTQSEMLDELVRRAVLPPGFRVDNVQTDERRLFITVVDHNVRHVIATLTLAPLQMMAWQGVQHAFQRAVDMAVRSLQQRGDQMALCPSSEDDRLTAEVKRLNDEVARLGSELAAHKQVDEEAAAEIRRLSSRVHAALAFIAGLSLRDHPIAEQRQQREVVSDLMHLLKGQRAER